MRNDVGVFIITHKRAEKVLTLEMFEKAKYSGQIWLVVDDQDEQLAQYKAKYKNLLVFSKEDYKNDIDTHINKFEMNGAIFARNACNDFAQSMRLQYFFVCDDDLKRIYIKNPITGKMITKESTKSIETIIEKMVEYLESAKQIKAIALADDGAFFGGINKEVQQGIKYTLTKIMLYRAEEPVKYESSLFEDMATVYSGYGIGELAFSIMMASVSSLKNGTNEGGCKELYEKLSYYIGGFMVMMCRPDAVKIIQKKMEN